MNDIQDITSIKLLVDEFYTRVRLDGLLGPIFAEVIKNDWQPHLDKMYAFWNAALFGVPGFKGNPFASHAPLPIGNAHFDRWLDLFKETVDAHFAGPMANDAKNRAGLMAVMFMSKLANMKSGSGRVIM
ncbi:group III truncated hemoglobin [Mucilaginibacter gossypii]|uniref:group III truncated hemoglobin n=1 Tax=Mucilaginibacter gossypii TaxID=551996 RepID=UPI000DCD9E72|nr:MULTISPECIES: group III truncated hemoglobin [Mucilaginibacter]QTE37431.1 group III truncated hemoglobin [Mucilaginibacter gossypii]RAV52697.1 globin [Mucilaginibacter rubeus]